MGIRRKGAIIIVCTGFTIGPECRTNLEVISLSEEIKKMERMNLNEIR